MITTWPLVVALLGAAPVGDASGSPWVVLLRLPEAWAADAKLAPVVGAGLDQTIKKNDGARVPDDKVEEARTALNLAEVTRTDLPTLLDSVGAEHALLVSGREVDGKLALVLERYDRALELHTTVERPAPPAQLARALRQALSDLLARAKPPRSKAKAAPTPTPAPADARTLGLHLATISPTQAKAVGLKKPQGAWVVEVLPGHAAATAGLRADDVLLALGKAKLRGAFDAPGHALVLPDAGPIPIEVWRDGARLKLELFGPPPSEPAPTTSAAEPPPTGDAAKSPSPTSQTAASPSSPPAPAAPPRKLGAKLRPITPELAESLGLMGPTGALVVSVTPGSIAASAGLTANDVVLSFNDQPVAHPTQLAAAVQASAPRLRVPVELWRNRSKLSLVIVFPETPPPGPAPTAPAPRPPPATPKAPAPATAPTAAPPATAPTP